MLVTDLRDPMEATQEISILASCDRNYGKFLHLCPCTELQHLSEMLLGQGQVEPRLGRVEAGLIMGNNWKPLHKLLINLNKNKNKSKRWKKNQNNFMLL